jgi:PAS domain S-box-containing protein
MKPLTDLIHPDDIEQILSRHTKRVKGNKVPDENYFRFIKKSGEIRWAQMNTVAIDWEGQPATLNFVNDVTERKRMEEALCESEERHRALVEASSKAGIGMVILQSTEDQEAVIVFANDGAIQITGYTKEEILSKPLSTFMPPDDFLIVLERYRNRQKGIPTISYYETYIIYKDGSMIPVLISAATLKHHDKIATVVYFREVTQLNKAGKSATLYA